MCDYMRFTVVRHRWFNTRSTGAVYIVSRSKKENDGYKFENRFDKFQHKFLILKIRNKTKSIYCSQT